MKFFRDPTANDKSHINTLRFVIALLAFALLGVVTALIISAQEPETQRLSIPPEIRYGANVKTGEVYPWEIYNFAGMVNQLINNWQENGAVDYEKNLASYSALFTRRYLTQKYNDYKSKLSRGELEQRLRSTQALGHWTESEHCGAYSENCVKSLGSGRWQVWLDVSLKEHQITRGANSLPYLIKDEKIRIPVIVVYENDQPQYNPWGLKLDIELSDKIQTLGVSQ
ncbi:DUF2895 family protein [Thiomicrospira sp.]|uniref:DUF2895 family protein n=1 Tax=Thiomicrospira sp. TaxID=935 RepID=UPI002F95F3C2